MANATTDTTDTTDTTPASITDEQYNDALQITAAYERAKQEAIAAQRAAYAVAVSAFISTDEFKEVYTMLVHMLANYSDDSFFGMPVEALKTISKNLASQVGVDLDATPSTEANAASTPDA